ncbi:hypothetical protein Hdeb2414_s0006g00216091 [Helianthus debilis subsp. tardiflorus]
MHAVYFIAGNDLVLFWSCFGLVLSILGVWSVLVSVWSSFGLVLFWFGLSQF